MNTKGILRPDELPFECPLDLEIAINNLIDGNAMTTLTLTAIWTKFKVLPAASAKKTMHGFANTTYTATGERIPVTSNLIGFNN